MTTFEFSWNADGCDYYGKAWQPEGPPKAVILLIHGLAEHINRYDGFAAFLVDAGYAVIGWDHYGHGKSSNKRGHIPEYETFWREIEQVEREAANHFRGFPIFAYGHSMGGGILLSYAIAQQPKHWEGMVISAPLIRPAFEAPRLLLALARLMRGIWPTFSQSNQIDVNMLSRDKEVVKAYQEDPLVHTRITAELAVSILDKGKEIEAHTQELPIPCLLMHGTADGITDHKATEKWAKQLPGDVELRLWEGFYHELHEEPEPDRKAVLQAVVDWFDAKLGTEDTEESA